MLPKLTYLMRTDGSMRREQASRMPCLRLSAFCLSLSPNLALLSLVPRALPIRHAEPRTQLNSASFVKSSVPSVVFVSISSSGSDEGPTRRRRLPLLHRLHVPVRRSRRRPAPQEAAAATARKAGRQPLLHHHHHNHGGHHTGQSRRRRKQRGEGQGRGGVRGRHGGGAAAAQGNQDLLRGIRRGGGGRRGEGDRDRVPHRRAARRAHRLGRDQQGGRHGRGRGHGRCLLAALLPLSPPARDRHGPRRRNHHLHQLIHI